MRLFRIPESVIVSALLALVFAWPSFAETQDAPDVLYRNGLGKFSEGDYANAAALFQELVDRFGTEKEFTSAMERVLYALGCSYFNTGEYADALKIFDRYLQAYPKADFVDEVRFRIGEAHIFGEDYTAAAEAFRKVVSEHPDSGFAEDAGYQIGMCYFVQDDYEKAEQVFAEFCQAYPDSELYAQAAVLRARAMFEQEKWQEALAALKALQTQSRSLDHIAHANFLAREIGDIAFDETDYDLALDAYRQVITREHLLRNQRKVVEYLQARLAQMEQQKIDPAMASEHYRQLRRVRSALRRAEDSLKQIEGTPSYEAALYHRIGRCFFNSDRLWEARVAFLRVIGIAEDPSIREAGRFDLALVLSRQRRFPELIEVADAYLEEFGKDKKYLENGRVPTMAFMRAEAYINQERYEEAEVEMADLLKEFPDHPQRPRIEFYLALSQAMQEKFDEGISGFRQWLEEYPDDILRPDVEYWLPVALYYAGKHEEALPLFQDYMAKYPMSVYAGEAEYRAALCMYALERFKDCALVLGAWVKKHPDHYFRWESMVTRGSSLAAIGMLEEAEEEFLQVGDASGPYYYMALTELAKIYKALDTPQAYRRMADAFSNFIKDRPDSGNVIDAAYQAGWALKRMDRPDDARQLYWGILERYGDRKEWEGFGSIFEGLRQLYTGDEARQFEEELKRRYAKAARTKDRTLALRLRMGLRFTDEYRDHLALLMEEILEDFKIEEMGPEELALAGEYLAGTSMKRARVLFEYLLETYPKSRFASVGYIKLSESALTEEQYESALVLSELGIATSYDPALLIDATFVRARSLHELDRYEDAIEAYKLVLANRITPLKLKPQCLLGIGDCLERQGDAQEAIPYYQRIYVLYGAFPDAVAKAYLKSGRAFEKIRDIPAAVNTYRELLANEDLKDTPEFEQARRELTRLES